MSELSDHDHSALAPAAISGPTGIDVLGHDNIWNRDDLQSRAGAGLGVIVQADDQRKPRNERTLAIVHDVLVPAGQRHAECPERLFVENLFQISGAHRRTLSEASQGHPISAGVPLQIFGSSESVTFRRKTGSKPEVRRSNILFIDAGDMINITASANTLP